MTNTHIGHCMLSSMSVRMTRAEAWGSFAFPLPLLFLLAVGFTSPTVDRLRLVREVLECWLSKWFQVAEIRR